MAPFVAAASSAATDATSASSAYADAAARASPSPPSSSRRAAPTLLLLASLAALLILSSGVDAAAQHLKDISLQNPEITFAPSSVDGQFCERIRLSGIPRLHLASYASQIHTVNAGTLIEKVEAVSFCRNASMGLCQCEMGEWQAFQSGMWNVVKSPYGNKYVDVKLADKKSASFTLSIQEEFQRWRLACLGIGFILLFLSPIVSKWAPFYYSSSMALGVLLVVLIVLFQVSIFLLIAIVLTGAGFGYWMVRRFILSKDGSVDAGIAQFVKWAMRVVATFFVMQSTLDPVLALVALAACWWVCSLFTANKFEKTITPKQKQPKASFQPKYTQGSPNSPQVQFLSPTSKVNFGRIASKSSAVQYGWNSLGNGGLGSTLTRRVVPNQDEDYYSTFHDIEPRKYSKKEWEEFTKESTRKALAECTATPEFAKWVADNAHRLQVEKDDDISEDDTMESSSNSSEEAREEGGKAPGLYWWSREQVD
ncbi:hypothetical protein PR202_ga12861 [Eleusine coracana subsp. coracana]|uniref:Uncharacterized protein n=1 Tax=Eleusine coracana subsp. coracana TaxID=191504 RepID=A0AAV5CD78_ELECO|nr:hypothetical protein PR202_ga12861 [Eleusine coracana subsp. coracana]